MITVVEQNITLVVDNGNMNSSDNATTEMEMNSTRWLLDERLVGGVISFFISVEFMLSFITNLFIILHTIYHNKTLRQSSTVLLFNLALTNLMMTVLFMPFAITASAAEEWIFGSTDAQREIPCQITAFVFAYTVSISVHTLAAISFDRFLLIVKQHWHKRFMSWKTALGIVVFIWLYSILLDSTPFYGLGEYDFSRSAGACIPIWVNNRNYVIFFSILSLVPFTIIVVTTAWTYIFTRRFLQKDFIRRKNTVSKERLETERNVYNERLRHLLGIFGTLLLFNVLTLSPYIAASVVGLMIGLERIPAEVFTIAFVFFLLSNVSNSIIQAYFRQELRSTIMKYTMMLATLMGCGKLAKRTRLCCCCPCLHNGQKHHSPHHESNANRDLEGQGSVEPVVSSVTKSGGKGSIDYVQNGGPGDTISKAASTEVLGSVDLNSACECDDPLPVNF